MTCAILTFVFFFFFNMATETFGCRRLSHYNFKLFINTYKHLKIQILVQGFYQSGDKNISILKHVS